MLHAQGALVSPSRIGRALQTLQSSSPSYVLMASLDAARAQAVEPGTYDAPMQAAQVRPEQAGYHCGTWLGCTARCNGVVSRCVWTGSKALCLACRTARVSFLMLLHKAYAQQSLGTTQNCYPSQHHLQFMYTFLNALLHSCNSYIERHARTLTGHPRGCGPVPPPAGAGPTS